MFLGDLVATGKAAHPAMYNINGYLHGEANAQLSMSCIVGERPVGLQVPTPSPVRHGTAFCGLLFQQDFLVLTSSTRVANRYPRAGPLGRHNCASTAAKDFAFSFCLWQNTNSLQMVTVGTHTHTHTQRERAKKVLLLHVNVGNLLRLCKTLEVLQVNILKALTRLCYQDY